MEDLNDSNYKRKMRGEPKETSKNIRLSAFDILLLILNFKFQQVVYFGEVNRKLFADIR